MRQWVFLILAGWLLLAGQANAFVVQEGNPLSYQMMARDGAVDTKTYNGPVAPKPAPKVVDDKVNYQAIAKKLFPSRQEFISVNLLTSTYQSISVRRDFLVRVILPQSANTIWRIETNEGIIKPLSTQKLDEAATLEGVRTFEFLSVKRGNTKIYLDNFNPKTRQVIQSRVIRVRVY